MGSFFDDFFGGGEQKTEQTLPGYVTQTAEQASNMARNYASRPYEAPNFDTVAGLTNDQTNAYGDVRALADAGPQGFDEIKQILSGSVGASPKGNYDNPLLTDAMVGKNGESVTLDDYMNPYIDSVVQKVLADMSREGDIAAKNIENNSIMMGAAGGDDQHGIGLAEHYRNVLDRQGNTAAQMYADAFRTAAGLKNQDAARELQTFQTNSALDADAIARDLGIAGQMQNMSSEEMRQALQLAASQEAAGGAQQQQQQNEISERLRLFMEGRDWDKETASFLASIAGGLPAPVTTTKSEEVNPWSQVAQLGGSLASAYFGGGF